MKKFKGTVVFRYYQEVTVEVEDEEDDDQVEAIARALMCEEFDLGKADGESEVLDLEEVK
jgi:hypothetical protein